MRRPKLVVAAAAFLAAVVVTGAIVIFIQKPASPEAQVPPADTAKVELGNLSATVAVEGTLTYLAQSDGSPYSVINQPRGTYTKLPALGEVISQGQVLYRVNDTPVALLYGSTPAYRTLLLGATGPDVAELNADLLALGYTSSTQISPSSTHFGWATSLAVEKLQASLGIPQTGELTLGDVVFEPSPLRVTNLSVSLGDATQPSQTVMQATSTTRIVEVALDASQQTEVADGDTVTITLPNNKITPGVVSSVGKVATCPPSSGSTGSSFGSAAQVGDTCSSGNSGNTTPTIIVDIIPSRPGCHGDLGSSTGGDRYHYSQRAARPGCPRNGPDSGIRGRIQRRGRRIGRGDSPCASLARTL